MSTGMNGMVGLTHVYGATGYSDGVYMALQTGASSLQIYRRVGTALWSWSTTTSSPAQVIGQPAIEFSVARTTGNFTRFFVFGRFVGSAGVMTLDSDMNAVSFASSANPGWRPFDEDEGARAMVTAAMARDTQRAPFGLRGVDYQLVGNATVLGAQTPSSSLASCPVGAPVAAGARQVCFSGGVPVNNTGGVSIIDCGAPSDTDLRPTNGGCPAGYACQISGQQSFCTRNGFAPMTEERSPSVDGVIPARIEQQNEWPQMRFGYCSTGRSLRAEAFTPAVFQYPQPGLPGVTAQMTCPFAPLY